MVEFGAGGKVARREETTATAEADVGGEGGDAPGTPATPAPLATPTPTTGRERRKKKAKGWFCPVCRQREWL
jgi:hypothetical protein